MVFITPMFMALSAAVIAVVVIAADRHKKAQIANAYRLAAQHGFRVDTSSKAPPTQPFDLFEVGSSKRVSFQFWREGEDDSVFQYRYTTGSGDNKSTHLRTCALISLPFAAPHTKIGPEGFWSGIGRKIGVRDIEVESAAFNDQFRITSDDERFAVTLLDQEMIAWLLSPQSGRGEIKFELWGPWLLCVSSQLDMNLLLGFLDWSQAVRTHMPSVLPSLYPVR